MLARCDTETKHKMKILIFNNIVKVLRTEQAVLLHGHGESQPHVERLEDELLRLGEAGVQQPRQHLVTGSSSQHAHVVDILRGVT